MILYCCEETGVNFKYEELKMEKNYFTVFSTGAFTLYTIIPSAAWQSFFLLLQLDENVFSPENSKKGLWTPNYCDLSGYTIS